MVGWCTRSADGPTHSRPRALNRLQAVSFAHLAYSLQPSYPGKWSHGPSSKTARGPAWLGMASALKKFQAKMTRHLRVRSESDQCRGPAIQARPPCLPPCPPSCPHEQSCLACSREPRGSRAVSKVIRPLIRLVRCATRPPPTAHARAWLVLGDRRIHSS